MSARHGLLLAVLLLAACLPPRGEAPASTHAPDVTGDGGAETSPPNGTLRDLDRQWRRDLASQDASLLKLLPRNDGLPSLRLESAAFRDGSAELVPTMLTPLAEVAHAAAAVDCVVHVLGARLGEEGSASDSGERRAAAVAAVLGSFGVPPAHLRYQSQTLPGSPGGVVIVVRPIVAGSEAQAWMPPSMDESGGTASR